MLDIIHIFWDSTTGFYNDGKLALWVESVNSSKSKKGDYPPFWDKHHSFIDAMELLYQHIRRKHKNCLGSS